MEGEVCECQGQGEEDEQCQCESVCESACGSMWVRIAYLSHAFILQ